MRRLFVAAGIVALAVLPRASAAITGWQGFGSDTSYGRGSFASPWADIDTTTKRDPKIVRVTFEDGSRANRTDITWDIDCWRESDFDSWQRGGGGKYSLPRTITWDPPAWVDYCTVTARAYHFDAGTLKVFAQARY